MAQISSSAHVRQLEQTAALGSITPEQGRREKLAILDRYRLDCFDEKCCMLPALQVSPGLL